MKDLVHLSCNSKKVYPKATYDHLNKMVILSFYVDDKVFKYQHNIVHDPKNHIFKVSEEDYETIQFEIEQEMNNEISTT
jgi:hypothetical protein